MSAGGASGSGNLASDALSAALAYRAQAPVIDGLMKELGLDGGSFEGLAKAGLGEAGAAEPNTKPPAEDIDED
ncbi:flotillin domain-containing protein [Altererythrobacter sp. CAU 1778]